MGYPIVHDLAVLCHFVDAPPWYVSCLVNSGSSVRVRYAAPYRKWRHLSENSDAATFCVRVRNGGLSAILSAIFFVTIPLHLGRPERQAARPTRAWTTYCLHTDYLL